MPNVDSKLERVCGFDPTHVIYVLDVAAGDVLKSCPLRVYFNRSIDQVGCGLSWGESNRAGRRTGAHDILKRGSGGRRQVVKRFAISYPAEPERVYQMRRDLAG